MAVEDGHSAGGDHAAGSGFPPFDQVDTFLSQLFWLALTFGFLYFMLARVILPKIAATLAERDAAVATSLAAAAAANEAAETAVKAFDTRLLEARAAARETAAAGKADVDGFVAAEMARVEGEMAKRLDAAEARIQRARAEAMAGVAGVAEGATTAIVEKLVGVKVTAAASRDAVRAVLSGGA